MMLVVLAAFAGYARDVGWRCKGCTLKARPPTTETMHGSNDHQNMVPKIESGKCTCGPAGLILTHAHIGVLSHHPAACR